MADFGYCFDCNEMNYAIVDKNGVFEFNNMSNNHFGHDQHCFGKPDNYCAPIRQVLIKLNAGMEVSHNEIILFKLAIDLSALDKYRKNKPKEISEAVQQKLF